LVATAVARLIGKAVRGGKLCYYINDSVYHTYSGIIFVHEQLPDLEIGELVYSENIRAYAAASSTYFNGFPPAKVVVTSTASPELSSSGRFGRISRGGAAEGHPVYLRQSPPLTGNT